MSDDDAPFCYLTTTGRVTGRAHTIEIWFGRAGTVLYLLSGGRDRSDWVRNLVADPDVTVRIGRDGEEHRARARVLSPDDSEDALARSLLLDKYQRDDELASWGATSLAVALDLDPIGG